MTHQHRSLRVLLSASLIAAAFLTCLDPAHAQTTYGAIVGNVSDSSGAAIGGATVVLTNLGTNQKVTFSSDSSGFYQFVNLLPAEYRIDAEHPGFKRFTQFPIPLRVQQVARVDINLVVGDVAETVEVTGEAPLLESETSSLGQVVHQRKVEDLPLNGRNPLALAALVPGVVPGGCGGPDSCNVAVVNNHGWGNFQIGGGLANQSEALWDGAPLSGGFMNTLRFVPSQDALQEFKVQTNSFGSEFGRTAGGVINLTTRSGSNELRGSAYEFLRNRALNTNTFFNNANNVRRPPYTQNQFGATLGGPVVIPKVYDGRNKTFFFVNYEGLRLRRGIALLHTVADARQREGDFSQTFTAAGALRTIYDPATTRPDPNVPGAFLRDPFPGNRIQPSRFDPVSLRMRDLFALPNRAGAPLTGINNFATNASVANNSDQYTLRFDQVVGDKHRFFGRYSNYRINAPGIDPFGTQTTTVDFGAVQTNQIHNFVIDDTITFNPTTIVDLRYAILRGGFTRAPKSLGFDLTTLGLPAALNQQIGLRHIPVIRLEDFTSLDASTGSSIQQWELSHTINGSLSKFLGKHTLKVGGDVRWMYLNYLQSNSTSGDFTFNRIFTANNPLQPVGGFGYASFLLGLPAAGSLATPSAVANFRPYQSYFVQDDFRVTGRLTLNLGLRYDIEGQWAERFDRIAVFLPDAEHPLAAETRLPVRGRLGLVNSNDRRSRAMRDTFYGQWNPRVGFAYRLGASSVIRAGYGVFWLPGNLGRYEPSLDPTSSVTTPFVSSLDGGVTPIGRISNPFPEGLLMPPGRDPSFQRLAAGQGINGEFAQPLRAYAQQWNFNIQRTLPGEVLLDIAYAGAKGTRLPLTTLQANTIPEELMSLGASLQDQVPNPFFGAANISPGTLSRSTVARGQLLRPHPQYTSVVRWDPSLGDSSYQSMQLKVEKRFSAGASILASYTIAKLISNVETLTGWLQPTGGIQNPRNLSAERSLSAQDVPQRLVVSYTYDIPIGRGRKLWSGASPAADKFVGGWAVNGIYTAQSGTPLFLTTAVNLTNSFGGGSRPDSLGRSAKLEGPAQQRLGRWFDTSAFAQPAAFRFGNLARTLPDARAHGINNWDFSVFKNTLFGPEQRFNIQFRAEFFNLFNRVQFGFPGNALGTPQFGVVNSLANEPRLIQMALKFIY